MIQTKPKTQYHHGDLQNALIDAAVAAMAEKGTQEFSLRDVTAKAGVSHTSIYRHFSSKNQLLAAVAEKGFRLFKEHLDKATKKYEGDTIKQLEAQTVAYVQFATDNPVFYSSMFSEKIELDEQPDSLKAAAFEALSTLSSLVEQSCQEGKLNPKKTKESMIALWAVRHGLSHFFIHRLLEGSFQLGKADVEKTTGAVAKLLSTGLSNEES